MSKHERTGWRDLAFSERHRNLYGMNCPMVDVDFLAIEYDNGKPALLVEYKHENAGVVQIKGNKSFDALIALGNHAGIPVFCTRYTNDFTRFRATPLNRAAFAWLSERTDMTEAEWVELMYRIRGRKLPTDIKDKLNSTKTW